MTMLKPSVHQLH